MTWRVGEVVSYMLIVHFIGYALSSLDGDVWAGPWNQAPRIQLLTSIMLAMGSKSTNSSE